jgi:Fe-S cluster biosynthesis and repair protein YggX
MTRKVNCLALGEELDGLAFQPYPGELGKRIFDGISQQAWQKWMAHQTMLINENRLSPLNPEHRKFLEEEMVKYLFEGETEAPAGYVPPDAGQQQ